MKQRKSLFILLLLMNFWCLQSQEMRISSVAFPDSHVPSSKNGLVQDQLGNIWMADQSRGLVKYDGEDFTEYRNELGNPNSLISDRLECIYAGSNGFIWIGSFATGLVRFDPVTEVFTNFQHSPGDPASIRSNSIRSIAQDRDGGLWIGTLEGLDYLDPETGQFEHTLESSTGAQILNEEHIRVLLVDQSGILWAGGSGPFYGEETKGGLFSIDPRTRTVKRYTHSKDPNSLIDNRVTAIFEDSRGIFWVGTAGDGLHTMNRAEGTFTRHRFDPQHPDQLSRPPLNDFAYAADHIRFINEDAQQQIWIGTIGNGINRYDPRTDKIAHFGTGEEGNYKIPSDYWWNSLRTKDDLLWMSAWLPASNEEVLIKVNLHPHQIYQKYLNTIIYAFAEGDDGSIYLGSADGRLIRIDSNEQEKILYHFDQFASNEIFHINKDGDGNLWISNNTGLHQYNVESQSLTSYTIGTYETTGLSNEIYVSDFLNRDSIFVGSINGFYLLDLKRKKFTKFEHTIEQVNEQVRNQIREIFIDSRNYIWVSFANFGLKRFDLATESWIDYPFVQNVQDWVRDIYEDERGNLYVGSQRSGLRKYDPKLDNFTLIRDEDRLLTEESNIFGIAADDDTTLWLVMPFGLLKYNLNSNKGFLFGSSWGIPSTQFSSYGLFHTSAGDYYVGTNWGYIKFRSWDFEKKSSFKAIPDISKFTVDDEVIPLRAPERYQFDHNQNNIALTLSYVNFLTRSGEKNLQYRLSNYDRDWRIGKNGEEVLYYNLLPGSYIFNYKARDLYGEWTENSFAFSINPPWWRTWWAYLIYAFVVLFAGWRVHLFQKARTIRAERERIREKELAQAREVEKAYTRLQETQAQLIQSEKMASLGELTAGIAHEIQNPLNFVNNFSKVSNELLEEMEEEVEEGNKEAIKEIMGLLAQNLEKITHHGERASGIVKGMLQHSRSNAGEKEPTDINAICDEYLRLAYHGMRARNKMFNVSMHTDFDESIGKTNVVPQDIGRVLLNLITNAFYAVNERRQKEGSDYVPAVALRTSKENGQVNITVSDNGTGIPKEKMDKIFQPFFTTKPTGQGTGLGLSLSYDIVMAHGGALKVNSAQGEGSTFLIQLPFTGISDPASKNLK